jgi:hypothetical protein
VLEWKAGEVGLSGEEVKDLKEDERGEWVVTVVVLGVVLGSPVPRLEKDRDWTGPRLPKTGNSQDRQRPQPRSGLRSLTISEI